MISALYVETNGCYFNDPRIDPWDIKRDALNYDGPNPVIAHPPCQLWGSLAYVNYERWGGDHNRPGNDGGTFEHAVKCVQKFGGVLEHPKKTRAWQKHGLFKPNSIGWQKTINGWVCEVWQSAYGHLANKATWLYYVGPAPPINLNWDRPTGSHQIGGCDSRGKHRNKPTISGASASRTPDLFKEALIALASLSEGRNEPNR